MFPQGNAESVIAILNCKTKRDLEKYCRSIVMSSHDFATALWVGMAGGFAPYLYERCFREWSPDHLALQEEDRAALSSSAVGVPFARGAQKAANKIFQTFEERRVLAAHLFYTIDHEYWYLFYFDQRDRADPNRHWKHGPHIHLITHHWPTLRLEDGWRQIQGGDANFPNKIHLRYRSE